MTREDLDKMQIKPWELGYEMLKQEGKIASYKTVSFTDEDENGVREIQMAISLPNTIERVVVKL